MAESSKIVAEAQRVLNSFRESADGMTTRELCEKEHMGEDRARKLLRALKEAGMLKAAKKQTVALNDKPIMVDCYVLVEAKRKK